MFVLTLLSHGGPTQAIVAACGVEERPGAAWLTLPGQYLQQVQRVRSCARRLAILVCVDGLASDVTAFVQGFRHPLVTGRRGRAITHTEDRPPQRDQQPAMALAA